ncbi:hypothetical protein C3E78_08325 [Aeromicrobium chenweiae]|uniref:Uncharacterized protein n=1 Tax=Aeromicrobium chenweiae TaxID=2079793 RepID=A0A2S0WLR2_9ACTN|nr:hypothetical protein C3E78_08325 [Aeromicrobium chenweiae]
MGGFSFEAKPVPLAESTMQVGFMGPYDGKEDPETLTFRSATAHLRNNSAGATATISVCLPRKSPDGGLAGGGAVHAPTLAEYCREARPVVSGTTLRWGTESVDGEFLVLTMNPTQPGAAEVDSVTFEYKRDAAHGGQSGVERVDGLRYVVRAS